jgi:hypothetical protein
MKAISSRCPASEKFIGQLFSRMMRVPMFQKKRLYICLLTLLLVCSCGGVLAQTLVAEAELPDAPSALLQQAAENTQTDASTQESDEERKARLNEEGEREVKTQEKQRILTVMPNFNTVINGQGVALSKRQKTELAVHATFDPANFVGAFFLAGLSEVDDTNRGFGWGPGGYAKRVGANLADVFDGTMLAGAVYPILLHQDPRFFRKGTGTIRSRVRHALLAAVICRGDNGHAQPNFSNVLGNFTAGLISNAYYPSDETGIRLSLVNSTVVTLEGAAGNIGLEFAPDAERWWHNRKKARQP